jgi:hypothetical protein
LLFDFLFYAKVLKSKQKNSFPTMIFSENRVVQAWGKAVGALAHAVPSRKGTLSKPLFENPCAVP